MGMTSLRSAVFSPSLQRSDESEVDASACDCCQTGVAVTARGPLLVYRDRSAAEIRDIYTTRRDGERWTTPEAGACRRLEDAGMPGQWPGGCRQWQRRRGRLVHRRRRHAGGQARAQQRCRRHFAAPVMLDQGDAVQGRVDVALDAAQAWVLWVREDGSGQSLWLARYTPDLSRELSRLQVAKLRGRGRATGFPQLALHGGDAYVVWTDVIAGAPQLRGAVYAVRSGSGQRLLAAIRASCSDTFLLPCAIHCSPTSWNPKCAWNALDAGLGGMTSNSQVTDGTPHARANPNRSRYSAAPSRRPCRRASTTTRST